MSLRAAIKRAHASIASPAEYHGLTYGDLKLVLEALADREWRIKRARELLSLESDPRACEILDLRKPLPKGKRR